MRTHLFTRNTSILPYNGLVLRSGQIGDEGFFRFSKPDPQTSVQNGAQFTLKHLVTATCAANNENNLDKIDGVVPMRNDLSTLVGKTVCALVYDSDVSADVPAGFASLKGATKGLTAFLVTAANPSPQGGSYLPWLTVNLLSLAEAQNVCSNVTTGGGAAVLTQ